MNEEQLRTTKQKAQVARSQLPVQFHFAYGAPGMGFWELTYEKGGNVLYSSGPTPAREQIRRIQVDEERWAAFWKAVHQAKVWDWSPHYKVRRGGVGNVRWFVILERAPNYVASEGDGAFPPVGRVQRGEPEVRPFEQLVQALSALTGMPVGPLTRAANPAKT